MYSNRHFPRASKCNPNNRVIVKLNDKNGRSVNMFSSYSYLGHRGYATVGKLKDKLPAGEYTLRITNYNYQKKAADIAINVYASEEMPDIPIESDGEPKPPVYKAPGAIIMTSVPGKKDYATCNGIYRQTVKKPFADWYNEKGNRAIFYCPRYRVWACSGRYWCKDKGKGDCSNIA